MWEQANMADNQHISLKLYGRVYMLCHYSRHTPATRVSVEMSCRCLTKVTQRHKESLVSNFNTTLSTFTPGIKMVNNYQKVMEKYLAARLFLTLIIMGNVFFWAANQRIRKISEGSVTMTGVIMLQIQHNYSYWVKGHQIGCHILGFFHFQNLNWNHTKRFTQWYFWDDWSDHWDRS